MAEKRKMMKPVKAWMHITGTNEAIDPGARYPVFSRKDIAKRELHGLEKHGFRIARVLITEVK